MQRDEKSAKAKAAELVRQFQARFGKAMEILIDDVLSYLCTIRRRIECGSVRPIRWSV